MDYNKLTREFVLLYYIVFKVERYRRFLSIVDSNRKLEKRRISTVTR
jgi:hypothetical protein